MADDSYTRHNCPQCGAINVVAMGDVDDCTSSMGEDQACKCWNCASKFWRGDINDKDYIEFLEMEDRWDPSKTPEQNLKDAYAEDGKPTEEYHSDDFERFLDSDCPQKPGCTWRGWIMERLYFANDSKDINSVKRARRAEVVSRFVKDACDPKMFRAYIDKPLMKAFSRHEGMDCRVFTDVKKKNGGLKMGATDPVQYRRKLRSLLCYMMGFDHSEIKP